MSHSVNLMFKEEFNGVVVKLSELAFVSVQYCEDNKLLPAIHLLVNANCSKVIIDLVAKMAMFPGTIGRVTEEGKQNIWFYIELLDE